MFEHERPDDARRPDESKDITSLPLAEIGRRLQYYTGMLAYAQVQLARQDQTAVACEYHHDVLKKQRMVLLDSGQQKYKLEATVTSEPTIQKAYQAVLEANAARAMFKAVVDGLKAKADLYSREVTRRGVEA
jgi:hypothetical protein